MKLTVLERIMLGNALPEEGNFLTLKIVRELREAMSFDEVEHKRLKLRVDGGQIHWDNQAAKEAGPKDIKIGEKATDVIVECLKKLDEQKKLTQDHLSLYEKFMVPAAKA